MDIIFILVVGFVLLAVFIAIIFAVVLVSKNARKRKAAPEIRTTAKVTRLNENQNSSLSVDSANARTDSTYYADFTLADKSKATFKVSKMVFLTLSKGDQGTIVYKGSKLISFQKSGASSPVRAKTPQATHYFFQNPQKSGPTVKFYADAPGLDVSIPSDTPIDCDYAEVIKYINKLFGSGFDNFFGLEKAGGEIIQFSNDGKDQTTEIDIPQQGGYSYKGMLYNADEVLDCVRDYFEGAELINRYKLTYEKW